MLGSMYGNGLVLVGLWVATSLVVLLPLGRTGMGGRENALAEGIRAE